MLTRAKCLHKNGEVLFAVEHNGGPVSDALAKIKDKLNHEFDHCFEADDWAKIEITIER